MACIEGCAYIERLRDTKVLVQGGPFPDNREGTDPRHGTPIISVADEATARAIVAQDPAVVKGILKVELRRWSMKFGIDIPM